MGTTMSADAQMLQASEEIEEFMNRMAEKHFISTWAVALTIRNDSATTDNYLWDGSEPEARGLVSGMLDDMRHRRITRSDDLGGDDLPNFPGG